LDQTNDLSSLVNKALQRRDDQTAVAQFRRDHDWNERFITASPFDDLVNPYASQRAA
jgi:hypothetical protein